MEKETAAQPEDKSKKIDTTLKYQYLIDANNLSVPCPNKCKPTEMLAYRFVKSATISEDDFKPNELEDKPIFFNRKPFTDAQKCMRCSISLFDSAEHALSKLELLSATLQEGYAQKMIAVGMLELTDGIGTEPNLRGHFSFYEYKNSKIYLNFEAFKHPI